MPNRNKKRNNHFYNNNNNNQNNNLNGGGGVRKGNNGYRNNRKFYLNPNIISSMSDDEVTTRSNERNGENGFNNRGSSERKGGNNRGKKMVDKFKDMGRQRPKMKLGDDDSESIKALLSSKPHCQVSNMPADVFNLIITYVQNYFTCYDTNREGLLGAYNKMCTFSLCINQGNATAYRSFKYDENVLKENRNLKRIVGNAEHHVEKRFKLQHRGYIDTLAQICKLPATEHDPRSFKLDIVYFTPTMIKYSLSGVFKEGKATDKVRPLRSFHRVFVCIPDSVSQMTIINEQFIISTLTTEQHTLYFSAPPEDKTTSSMSSTDITPAATTANPSTSQPLAAPQFQGLTEQQSLMLQQFSAQSRLNHEWSKHCLEHVNWNFDEAAKAFVQFKESIPKDAYI